MNVDLSLHMKNGLACKDKWGFICGEFKKNFNHIQEQVEMKTIVLWTCKTRFQAICHDFLAKSIMI